MIARQEGRATAIVCLVLAAVVIAAVVLSPRLWKPGGFVGAALVFALLLFIYPTKAFLVALVLTPAVFPYLVIRPGMGLPNMTLDRIAIPAAVLMILFRAVLEKRTLVRMGRTEAFMALFSILACCSLLLKGGGPANVYFQKNDVASNLYLFLNSYGIPFLIFLLGKNLFASDRDARLLVHVLWGLGVYLAVLGIIQAAVAPRLLVPRTVEQIHFGRAVGPFGDATEFGVLVAISFLLTLFLALHEGGLLKRILASLSLALMVAALIMTYTRAVWIGVFVGLGLIQFGDRRVRAAFLVLILCAALALPAALVLAPSDSILTKRATALAPIYGRIVLLATAAKLVASRPLLGYGFSRYAFQEAKGGNLSTIGMVSSKWGSGLYAVHNEYMNLAIMLGLAGLSLYVMVLVSAGRSLLAYRRDAGDARFITKGFALFALGACSIYVFAGLFVNLIGMSFLSGVVYLLVGVVEARTLRGRSEPPPFPPPVPSSSLNRATFVK